jgi:hypothetical protein
MGIGFASKRGRPPWAQEVAQVQPSAPTVERRHKAGLTPNGADAPIVWWSRVAEARGSFVALASLEDRGPRVDLVIEWKTVHRFAEHVAQSPRRSDKCPDNRERMARSRPRSADGTEGSLDARHRSRTMVDRSVGDPVDCERCYPGRTEHPMTRRSVI